MSATAIMQRYINALPTFRDIDIDKVTCALDGGEEESQRMAMFNHDGIEWYKVLRYDDEKFNVKHELESDKRFGVRLKPSKSLDNLQSKITEKTGIAFERHDNPSPSDRYIDILDFRDISKIYHMSKNQVVTDFCQDALAWFARQSDIKITVNLTPNLSRHGRDEEEDALRWQWEVCHVLINEHENIIKSGTGRESETARGLCEYLDIDIADGSLRRYDRLDAVYLDGYDATLEVQSVPDIDAYSYVENDPYPPMTTVFVSTGERVRGKKHILRHGNDWICVHPCQDGADLLKVLTEHPEASVYMNSIEMPMKKQPRDRDFGDMLPISNRCSID